MQGKVCLITGATAGIGEVAATELARLGARVVIVGRSAQRCAATQERIRSQTGAAVETLVADLSSLDEVKRLAGEVRGRYPRLDVLLNNAGAMFLKRSESADGIEKTFALNHLSYFTLTNLLLPVLNASTSSRIVNVASDAHRGVSIDFDDLQFQHKKYSGWKAYQQSKLANVLFSYELARRLEGTQVTANALHPGFVRTNFLEALNDMRAAWLIKTLGGFIALSPEQGAETSIHLASSPEVDGVSGRYFVKKKAVVSSPQSRDQAAAQRLWRTSEEMTGVATA